MIQNAIGKPVQGDDFFDRKREVRDIWERLETDDILLLAPRRVGKTSLMYRLRETASANGYQAIHVNVADAQSELSFARKILAEILKNDSKKTFAEWLKSSSVAKFFAQIDKVGVAGFEVEFEKNAEEHWATVGESIVAALSATGSRWLLLIDELPIFILTLLNDDAKSPRARAFLNWFRTLRQNAETGRNVRWLLAGSIGLDTVARRMKLGDTINDLYLYTDFGAFTRETAHAFLDALALAYGMTLSDEVKQHICDRTGWLIPFHIQLCFGDLRAMRPQGAPSIEDVDAVFENLLAPAKKSYFDFWRQRLKQELGSPDDGRAVRMLDAVAADDDGVSRQTLLGVLSKDVADAAARDQHVTYLVDVLLSDGYLVLSGGRYYFRSSLLREYWRRSAS